MSDLIDRKALGVGKCSEEILPHAYCVAWNSLIDIIEKAPTVDAVEVVRCKDCRHNVANMTIDPLDETDYSGDDIVCAYFSTDGMQPDDFCSYGERRTE